MKRQVKKGSTSVRLKIFISDSSSTTGAGLTGLAYNSASLTWYYHRDDSGNAGGTQVTLASATKGTFTSGGFVEIDSTNLPGWYEIGVPDAALASGANAVAMHLKGATNMAPLPIELELVSYDPNDAAALGLSRVDAAITSRLAAADVPANFSTLGINASGHVSRVVLCDTLTTYTNNTPQSGDAYSRIGANGSGLSALGDTRIANLDATVSSRLADASYTAPDNSSIAAILVDTNELQTDWANGGRLELRFDTLDTSIAAIPDASENAEATAQWTGITTADTFAGKVIATQGIIAHLPDIDAGDAGGLLIVGTNNGDVTIDGQWIVTDGVQFLAETANRDGFICQGTGTGNGAFFKSGTGSVAAGLRTQSYATNGHGLGAYGSGTGNGFYGWGGAGTGQGMKLQGGDTSGHAFEMISVAGDVVYAETGATGHGVKIIAAGTSKNAIELTPGSGGVGINGTLYGLITTAMQAIADTLLGRRISGGASTGRTVSQALATIRNKVDISGNTLTVYDVDDVTPLYTATITSSSAANPITGIDPS